MSEVIKLKSVDDSEDLKATMDVILTSYPEVLDICDRMIGGVKFAQFEIALLTDVDLVNIKIVRAHIQDAISQLASIGEKLARQDRLDGLKTNPLSQVEAKLFNELAKSHSRTFFPTIGKIIAKLKSTNTENITVFRER